MCPHQRPGCMRPCHGRCGQQGRACCWTRSGVRSRVRRSGGRARPAWTGAWRRPPSARRWSMVSACRIHAALPPLASCVRRPHHAPPTLQPPSVARCRSVHVGSVDSPPRQKADDAVGDYSASPTRDFPLARHELLPRHPWTVGAEWIPPHRHQTAARDQRVCPGRGSGELRCPAGPTLTAPPVHAGCCQARLPGGYSGQLLFPPSPAALN